MRPRPRRGDCPHAQADLLRTVDYGGRWPRPPRGNLYQGVGHRVPLSLGHRHIDVLHHAYDSAPALGRVARTHPVDVMAATAVRDEGLLSRAIGKILLGRLGPCRWR